MGKIYCVMGKSASGKDSIYEKLLCSDKINVKRIIPYTTRPIRDGEIQGETYFYCSEDEVKRLEKEGKIIELRTYDTVYGPWRYFTVDDGQFDLDKGNYLLIGTLETYVKIRDYFKEGQVIPLYIEVEDGERLIRAISREKQQQIPKYEEMCRRFLADQADFSEENIVKAGITKRFENNSIDETIAELEEYIFKNI